MTPVPDEDARGGEYTRLGGGRWIYRLPADFEFSPHHKLTDARKGRLERMASEWIYHHVHGGPEPVLTLADVFRS